MTTPSTFALIFSALCLSCSLFYSTAASAATLYSQNFVGKSGLLNQHNWAGYQSSTAVPVISTTGSYRAGSINNFGLQNNLPGDPVSTVEGYIFAQSYATSSAGTVTTAASNYFLHMSTALPSPVDLDGFQSLSINWSQSASDANINTRLAIQLDNSAWYVISVPKATPGGQGNTTFTSYTADILSQTWHALNFTPNSALSVNTSTTYNYTSLNGLGSNITALGLYIDMPAASATYVSGAAAEKYITLRLDGFSIVAVPEPSRALLFLIGSSAVFARRRQTSFLA